jgi:GAF domain-containing protein
MVDDKLLVQICASYASRTLGSYDLAHVLHELTEQIMQVINVDGAGVFLWDNDMGMQFVAATGRAVQRAEEAQLTHGEGPCYDAFHTGEMQYSGDLVSEARWPVYSEHVTRLGFGAAAGFPMRVADQKVGVLNVYRRDPRPWNPPVLEAAQLLADVATGYIVKRSVAKELVDAILAVHRGGRYLSKQLTDGRGAVLQRFECDDTFLVKGMAVRHRYDVSLCIVP